MLQLEDIKKRGGTLDSAVLAGSADDHYQLGSGHRRGSSQFGGARSSFFVPDVGPDCIATGHRPQSAHIESQHMLPQRGMVPQEGYAATGGGLEAFGLGMHGRSQSESTSSAHLPNHMVLQAAVAALRRDNIHASFQPAVSRATPPQPAGDNTLRNTLHAIPAPHDTCAPMVPGRSSTGEWPAIDELESRGEPFADSSFVYPPESEGLEADQQAFLASAPDSDYHVLHLSL